jgi:Helicase conserved C-terminal domain
MTMPSTEVPRSLAHALRGYSDEELAAVLRARPDIASPVPADIAQLTSRATTRTSALRALERLDRFTLDVLDAVAVREALADQPVTLPAVARLLGLDSDAVRPMLQQLRIHALLWGPDDHLRLVRIVREILGPYPGGLGPSVRQCLRVYPPRRLAHLVSDVGLRPTGNPVTDAAAVAALFADPVRLDALLHELDDPQARAYLDRLKDGPPTAWLDDALRDVDVAHAQTPVDQLLARGLLVPVEHRTVVLPGEVGLHLRQGRIVSPPRVSAPAPDTTAHNPQRVDRVAAGGALEAVRRVELLLESWGQAPPAALRAGGLGVRDLRRAAKELDVDETTAALLAEVAYAAGLVGASVDRDTVWLPTKKFDEWTTRDPAEQWAEIAGVWLATSRVAGLVGTRDENGRLLAAFGYGLQHPLMPELRRLTLEVLATLPEGASAPLDDVLAIVRWRRPHQSGPLASDLVRWTLAEAESLGITGAGALSGHGRELLAGADAAAALARSLPTLLDHILLQADFTAIAPGPLQPSLARELALVADVESRGGATVYRFSAKSVRRALDAGRTPEELQRFLTDVSRTPVPQPLSYLIDDLGRRHGEVRVGSARSFLRGADESVLTQILADRRVAKLGLRRLAPTVAASELPAAKLVELLRAAGYLPIAESADGSVRITSPPRRRAPTDARHVRRSGEPADLSDQMLELVIRALRAGETSEMNGPRLGFEQAHAVLAEALRLGAPVWVEYVDYRGTSSGRFVNPTSIDGGWLLGSDYRTGAPCDIGLPYIRRVVVLTPE